MRWTALLLVLATACATDPMSDDPDEQVAGGDGKADGVANPLIGKWIANEAPTNGDIHTFQVYMRGTFTKKPAYETSSQTATTESLISTIDWGMLVFHPESPVMYFDSKAGNPPTPRAYQVSGEGDERTLILQSDTDYREYHLDLGAKCGGSLPKCIDHFSCKAGWCVADHPF